MSSWAVSGFPSPPSGSGHPAKLGAFGCRAWSRRWSGGRHVRASAPVRPACGLKKLNEGWEGQGATTAGTMPSTSEMSLDPEHSHAADELVVGNPPEPFGVSLQ